MTSDADGPGAPTNARRTRVRRAALAVVGFGVLLLPILEPVPLRTGAYLQNVTARSVVVARISDVPSRMAVEVVAEAAAAAAANPADGLVDAVEHDAADRVAAAADRAGAPAAESGLGRAARWFDSGVPKRRQRVALSGLEPATRYRYRVFDGERSYQLDAGTFRTLAVRDGQPIRFAVIGDSGGQPWWVWMQQSLLLHGPARAHWLPPASTPAAIGRRLAEARPDFWLHLGDVVYPRGQQRHYSSGFFRPFADVLRSSPCFAVLGNHDVMTDGGGPFLANFVLPDNPVTGDGRCFSFVDGPLRVIALDLNQTVDRDHPSIRFLRAELARAAEPWIVVISHYPVDSVYRQEPRRDLEQHLMPLLRERGVDLLLAGHDHNYQRFGEPGDAPIQVVSGGGGKSLYEVRRRPPNLAVAEREYHYCLVEVHGARLTLRAIALDGTVLDRFTIDKGTLVEAGRISLDATDPRDRRIRALLE